MTVAITAATSLELDFITSAIGEIDTSSIQVLQQVTGVGMLQSSFAITQLINFFKPDLVLQIGLAGSFDDSLEKAGLVAVKREYLGDTGVEELSVFKDIFDMNLEKANCFPFVEKALINDCIDRYNLLKLPVVTGITVNEVSTRKDRIRLLQQKYNPSIETMEGAALHYACLHTSTPFLQMRAISNCVGERDKAQWEIKKSLHALGVSIKDYLSILIENSNSIS